MFWQWWTRLPDVCRAGERGSSLFGGGGGGGGVFMLVPPSEDVSGRCREEENLSSCLAYYML